MKTAFKIISFSLLLGLASCEKAVIVPAADDSNSRLVNGVLVVDPSQTNGGITDPNDRNFNFSNGVGLSNRVSIVDPTDSGNSNGKKPKR